MTNDHVSAALVHGFPQLSTYPEIKSCQFTIIEIRKHFHNSSSIGLSYAQRTIVDKSSRTQSKLIDTTPITTSPLQPHPQTRTKVVGADLIAPTQKLLTSIVRRTGGVAEQPMVVPKRTTSLKEPPKGRNRSHSLSLHGRGCRPFSSIDSMLASAHETPHIEGICESRVSTRHTSVSLQSNASHGTRRSTPAPEYLARTSYPNTGSAASPKQAAKLPSNTVISWSSDETRLVEYEKIDRAHSGFRGFCKELLPKSWYKASRRNFFNGECDGESVRRYRLSIPEKMGAAMMRERGWSCFS